MSAPAAESTLVTATAARQAQLAIRARLLVDVAKVWPLLDPKNLPGSFPGWLNAMRFVVNTYHAESAATAGAFYRQTRERATLSPAPQSLVKVAPLPADDWLDKAFRYSGPGMLSRDTVRPRTALSTTLGTATRIALDGGRTTVIDSTLADPVAVGWYRVTDGSPCAFCALLASRGVVYKDDSFKGSNARFHGPGEFKVHNDCGCNVAPAFSRSEELPDVSRQALDVYRSRGKGDAMTAFRKAWAAHQSA